MLGHIIYNYNQLDDARIQQEISKNLYNKKFKGVHLVHAYNGKPSFGYKPYLEDKFIKIKNRGHYNGATDLMNAGISYFDKLQNKKIKYILVTAADTWALDVNFLHRLVAKMEKENKVLATCSWGSAKYPMKPTGFATDFFILDITWNKKSKLFPIDFDAYEKKFVDVLAMSYSIPLVEGALQYQYAKYYINHYKDNDRWDKRNEDLLRITQREPIHIKGKRIYNFNNIGLYTSNNPTDKIKALSKYKCNFGKYSRKLLQSKSTNYYNKI